MSRQSILVTAGHSGTQGPRLSLGCGVQGTRGQLRGAAAGMVTGICPGAGPEVTSGVQKANSTPHTRLLLFDICKRCTFSEWKTMFSVTNTKQNNVLRALMHIFGQTLAWQRIVVSFVLNAYRLFLLIHLLDVALGH